MAEKQMETKRAVAAILLIIFVALLADRMLAPPPVQIVVQEGSALAVQGEAVFTIRDVLILAAFAWAGGMCALYLLLPPRSPVTTPADQKKVEMVLALLEEDERDLFKTIVEGGGKLHQSDLVVKTQFSESKVSRLLDRMERKGLVVRMRQGVGNVIALRKL